MAQPPLPGCPEQCDGACDPDEVGGEVAHFIEIGHARDNADDTFSVVVRDELTPEGWVRHLPEIDIPANVGRFDVESLRLVLNEAAAMIFELGQDAAEVSA